MCSFLGLTMDNSQGDLTDILRAGGGLIGCGGSGAGGSDVPGSSCWPQLPSSDPMNFHSTAIEDHSVSGFGNPFSTMRDPLLHEVNVPGSGSAYFGSPSSSDMMSTNSASNIFEDEFKSACNIFPRMQIASSSSPSTQVSPCDSPAVAAAAVAAAAAPSPRGIKAPAVVPSDTGPVQISSPRNLGIKRRKSQAKKVVCIPAPAAANSRSSGEVVPSDLWAWRKYGQKPIKGSPYPRGYYRCSSSKGCSARKQVERSRTDPNMLVITYTSEHNHPWPTQRNALAGSTRSQPSKNNVAAASSSKSSPSSQPHNNTAASNANKEEIMMNNKESSNNAFSPIMSGAATSSTSVKEEMEEIERQTEMEDIGVEFNEAFTQTYRPALPDSHHSDHDFFADLDEIETDLLFTEDEQKEGEAMDPFSLFDWSGDNINNNTSFGAANRGL